MQLNDSGVIFNEEEHTYTLNGRQLNGITQYIKQYICPDKYKFVSDAVLARAAKRGSEIHKGIELMNLGFMPHENKPEYENYRSIVYNRGLTPIANEYTVTDGDFFATNIDCVYTRWDEIIIVDYKTTAKLDHDYLAWQLSICAYLFELQNPQLKVSQLAAMWLRDDKADFVTFERIPDDDVEDFLQAAKNGDLFVPNKDALAVLYDVEQEIINIDQAVKQAEERKKQLQEILKVAMERSNTVPLKTDRLSITYKQPSKQKRFDSKRLKEEKPNVYNEYLTVTDVKSSVLITIKKNG